MRFVQEGIFLTIRNMIYENYAHSPVKEIYGHCFSIPLSIQEKDTSDILRGNPHCHLFSDKQELFYPKQCLRFFS